jgi:lysophospholipase L1-like esterase
MKLLLIAWLTVVTTFGQFGGSRGDPSIPTANLIVHYKLNEGSGNRLINSVYSDNLVNLIAYPEQYFQNTHFWTGSLTPTDGFTNNPVTGLQTASRMVATAGGWRTLSCTVSGAAGQYTISVWAISNTGGNQTMRLYGYDGTFRNSGNLTIPTTWTNATFTFTYTGPITAVYLSNDTSTSCDVSVWGFQMQAGASATPYVPAHFQSVLGPTLGMDATDPQWTSHGTIDCGGAIKYTVAVGEPVSLSALSFYALAKWNTNPISSSDSPLLRTIDGSTLGIDSTATPNAHTNNPIRVYFNGGNVTTPYSEVVSNEWHVIGTTYDGTTLSGFVDDQLVFTQAASGTISLNNFMLSSFAFTGNWPGEIGYVLGYNIAHSKSQMATVVRALKAKANLKGFAFDWLKKVVILEGDSITTGLGAAASYGFLACTSNSIPALNSVTNCVSGSRLELQNGGVTSVVAREPLSIAYLSVLPKTKVWSLLIGANDLGTGTYATGTDYYNALSVVGLFMKSMGFRVCQGTVLANASSTVNTKRNVCNPLIRADSTSWDAVANYDSTALGVDGNAGNTTYFQDGIHPTSYGHTLMAPVFKAALDSIP